MRTAETVFSRKNLEIDAPAEVERICRWIQDTIALKMKRQGAVVALSGGIDSSTVAALCVRALGPGKVFGLQMPEQHSSEDTLELSGLAAAHFGIEAGHQDITEVLTALGCYTRQEAAYRRLIPEYGPGWRAKIVLPGVLEAERLRLFSLIAVSPEGRQVKKRLDHKSYLEIVAATNFKQRVRKMFEYYHADRLNYAVTGTPNRLEYDQGFFVKLGDGAADIKPIAHLYKSQVYQLAEYLGVPGEIRSRPPTTDTYSLPQSQEEFYFSLSYEKMDLCLYGKNKDIPRDQVASAAGINLEQLERVYADIEQKRRTTAYLHMAPQVVQDIFHTRVAEGKENVQQKS
ncbi:NAD(+) synthase [Marispirochaeta aestuarii]|uniref:NAD(+) synthase n=1 Tax=Marispirochaeta aestuarii TaxID=1963862 RepID=UPI0029C90FBA|nr:NAD(+) synthase [Marispirochaeta aestuarii]